MWSRISNALKTRPGTPALDTDDDRAPSAFAGAHEQHPNLPTSELENHNETFSASSPPASMSRNSKRNVFKRMSKVPLNENVDTVSKNTLSKKVLSSLQNVATENSRSPPSAYNHARPSQESERTSFDSLKGPSTPIDGKPTGDMRFSSIRSILKPNNTPGTGQSVRFFSRDAYRVISPTQSSASEFEDPSVLDRVQRPASSRPSLQSVFPTPSAHDEPSAFDIHSTIRPIPPPDLGNIFDFTSEELPSIPPGYAAPLHDSAIEVSEGDDKSLSLDTVDGKQDDEEPAPQALGDASPTVKLTVKTDRSNSFSFGQNLLQSLADSSPTTKSTLSPNRHRALSDTNIFTSVIPSATAASDINNIHNAVVAYQSPERDPFAANAMTYYTPGTMLPPSPPRSTHTRTASREEDLIWSLRTQLALRQELCAQYEIDLAARDETVELLNARLGEADKELDRRKNAIRAWRKRVTELEKCVGRLEDEADRSREESMDRSVMDEASSEALRVLQRRIGELERENKEKHSQAEELREEVAARTEELEKVKEQVLKETDREPAGGEERHRTTATTWEQERAELLSTNGALQHEQEQLQLQLNTMTEELAKKEKEFAVLESELEAQWKHTEQHSEELARLKHEKEELMHEVETLREKLTKVESEWKDEEYTKHDLESELQEAWAMKDDLGIERDQLERDLQAEQEHADELTRALQEREDRVAKLEQECQFAMDSVKRLQENIRQRDAEIGNHLKRIKDSEAEADNARDGLSKQKREHNRIVDEQSRRIADVVAREVEARAAMEQLVKDKAEMDVEMTTLKDRVSTLNQELERLRRQVHELHQESADKEVKLVQFNKQIAQLKEEKGQMNMGLEAKQQELELVKRAAGLSKTSAAAPTARPSSRRESSIFGTPSVARPSSVLSDASSTMKERKNSDPLPPGRLSVARSARPSGTVTTTARKPDQPAGPSSAVKTRTSPIATSTAPPRLTSVARSSSLNPAAQGHRRPSSSLDTLRNKNILSSRESISTFSNASDQEKENSAEATPVAKPRPARRGSVLVPS